MRLVEEDPDATGWIKVAVADDSGRQGLVPTAYCDFGGTEATVGDDDEVQQLSASTSEHLTLHAQGQPTSAAAASVRYARALYSFEASDDQEVSLHEGERVQLSEVGVQFGEGWAEVVRTESHHGPPLGGTGIVPVNYLDATEA